ncbi:hypothetical protein [Microbulbifer sp. PSTR4-B]|uniref:hypothetical protein n=1 Tax=unclassified Microbulbifer TaxID=2619833 RepID=UPI00403B36DB
MANNPAEGPSLTAVTESILQALATVPNVAQRGEIPEEFYIPGRSFSINTPALLLGFVTGEPTGPANNGLQPITIEWEILALVNNQRSVKDNHRTARELAISAVLALEPHLKDAQGKPLKAGIMDFVRMDPAQLSDTHGSGVAAYSLEYRQKLRVGVDRRIDPTPLPNPVELFVGYTPQTGPDHRDDYQKVAEVRRP